LSRSQPLQPAPPSPPDLSKGGKPQPPCAFDKGLRSKFPAYKFRVRGAGGGGGGAGLAGALGVWRLLPLPADCRQRLRRALAAAGAPRARPRHPLNPQVWDAADEEGRGFGLLGDADHLWFKDTRERQHHQARGWQGGQKFEGGGCSS
jgi:hypothetical protein